MEKHDHRAGHTCPGCAEAGKILDRTISDKKVGISNRNELVAFLHCGLCGMEVAEKKEAGEEISQKEYARLEVGLTPKGLQVWCVRHDVNVAHIDFEGQKHPANTTRRVDD